MPLSPPMPSESTEVPTSHKGGGSGLLAGQGGPRLCISSPPGVSVTPSLRTTLLGGGKVAVGKTWVILI